MKRKTITLLVAVIVIVGIAVAAAVMYRNQKHKNEAASSSSTQTPVNNGYKKGTPLTVSGKMTCLKSKNTSGVHTDICAIGIIGDDGKNYALSADDPTLTGSMPTGQQVKVTGTFIAQSTQYDMVGTIHVTSLERQ